MANLRNIKRRIKSVGGIRQITRAMEMVSATKLKKSQDRVENAKPYFDSMDSIVAHLMASMSEDESQEFLHPLMKPGSKDGDVLLVAIGSDKGLCASFNSNIIKEANSFIRKELEIEPSFRFDPPDGELDVDVTTPDNNVVKFKGRVNSKGIVSQTSQDDYNLVKAGSYRVSYKYKPHDGVESSGFLSFRIRIDTSGNSPKHLWTPNDIIEIPFTGSLKISKVLTDLNFTGRKVFVLAVGKRIYKPFSKIQNPRIQALQPEIDFDQSLPISELNRMTWIMSRMYTTGAVSRVHLLYTKYISAARQKITVEQFLPLGKAGDEESEFEVNRNYIFEPSASELFTSLIPAYARSKVFQALANSFTSEHSTRMTAMRNATDNATELIDTLTLKRNKARQAMITKELSEIVGGAEALKG